MPKKLVIEFLSEKKTESFVKEPFLDSVSGLIFVRLKILHFANRIVSIFFTWTN